MQLDAAHCSGQQRGTSHAREVSTAREVKADGSPIPTAQENDNHNTHLGVNGSLHTSSRMKSSRRSSALFLQNKKDDFPPSFEVGSPGERQGGAGARGSCLNSAVAACLG